MPDHVEEFLTHITHVWRDVYTYICIMFYYFLSFPPGNDAKAHGK